AADDDEMTLGRGDGEGEQGVNEHHGNLRIGNVSAAPGMLAARRRFRAPSRPERSPGRSPVQSIGRRVGPTIAPLSVEVEPALRAVVDLHARAEMSVAGRAAPVEEREDVEA